MLTKGVTYENASINIQLKMDYECTPTNLLALDNSEKELKIYLQVQQKRSKPFTIMTILILYGLPDQKS